MKLLVIAGPDSGKTFSLTYARPAVLGRGRGAHLQILDGHVSRAHCEILADGRKFVLNDLESAGGTYVNGNRVKRWELHHGDVIAVGQTKLQFESSLSDDESTLVLPAAARPDPTPSPDLAEPGDLKHLIGTTLGPFAISRLMSEDTYGSVFLADRSGQLQVLRVIWPQFADDRAEMNRFMESFRTIPSLANENLVAEYECGADLDYYWVSAEYVEGQSLSARLKEQPSAWPLEKALLLALQIGRGLRVAFENGLIHRHVTPSAIIVDHQNDHAKLAEIVFQRAMQNTFAGRVVRPGKLVGEIDYMSPERTRGLELVDTRSDIYGLGVILYELVTGHKPFEAENLPDLIAKIRTAVPVKPSRHVAEIPGPVDDLILKMLDKKPKSRFANPGELIAQIEAILQNQLS